MIALRHDFAEQFTRLSNVLVNQAQHFALIESRRNNRPVFSGSSRILH